MLQNSPAASSSTSASAIAAGSASIPEKDARVPTGRDQPPTSKQTPARAPKPRSCIVCRSRKVRCDKQSPCSNCRRANIACIFPPTDRPPRWTRRLERPLTDDAMERIRTLENLVRDLTAQLEQANARAASLSGSSPGLHSAAGSTEETAHQANPYVSNSPYAQHQFGRLVVQDANKSRYVGSGFWSRVNDEINQIKMDTGGASHHEEFDSSESEGWSPENALSTQEFDREPEERHAFLFRHNLSSAAPDLRGFHPLPSQIPFLLDVFSENVNIFVQYIHIPTVTKMIRDLRGDMTGLTPPNEALMFSIYYAAVTSMEEEDVMVNFGTTKMELNLKYRLGLEHALAKADFLNVPDLVLLQAFAIFLTLVRRHDSPRFVWMMTGLAIRMGLSLGLHRDGANFNNLSPFDIEMRRRVWWALCMLDIRASEDQGTEYTIPLGSFDTKIPLNINDADLDPDSEQKPVEREGLTDMSLALVSCKTSETVRLMMARGSDALSLEEQDQMLQRIYQGLEEGYLKYTAESTITSWVGTMVTRLVIAKMTLFIYLPILFASPSEQLSEQVRTKLLVAAIEVSEYNHALNAEHACRHWRWLFQTYTHWHAIVYILIEISRRQWSPLVERGWVALHSTWLIPTQSRIRNLRMWFPLRKLMIKAKAHRAMEIDRLKKDALAIENLEYEYRNTPLPSSPGLYSAGSNSADYYLEQWQGLFDSSVQENPSASAPMCPGTSIPSSLTSSYVQPASLTDFRYLNPDFAPHIGPTDIEPKSSELGHNFTVTTSVSPRAIGTTDLSLVGPQYEPPEPARLLPSGESTSASVDPWLWADEFCTNSTIEPVDGNMDLNIDIDWYNWVESAKGLESDYTSSRFNID
ncbi:hypothetical protein N7462_001710 [Penicillium macrosclerotiorum]|uniref:uncharacterized protein n=1 Tax=Penicillium macrosclerotiorum TaxID=303699 RepID=UPI002548DABB|nr:uncharacterized protein N7462_001710 [Penicillium macrosclerotiorum]KAJ5692287.1 hypothetical protein N7462_001710 [Penicillium macrosclerotiorum]